MAILLVSVIDFLCGEQQDLDLTPGISVRLWFRKYSNPCNLGSPAEPQVLPGMWGCSQGASQEGSERLGGRLLESPEFRTLLAHAFCSWLFLLQRWEMQI